MRIDVWRIAGFALMAACVMGPVVAAPAAEPPAGDLEGAADLTVITSEKLTFDYQRRFAFFEQDVVVVDPEMKLFADKMTVLFSASNRVTEIKAEGRVYIVQADKQARADIALYNVVQGVIVLTGKPQVTRGQDILTGDKITFWRDQNKMIVEPRARLVIHPEGDAPRTLTGEGSRGR